MVSSKAKFRCVLVSLPSNQSLEGVKSVQINKWTVPQRFSVIFLPNWSKTTQAKDGYWSVELKIFVTDEGVPNAYEVSVQQLEHKLDPEDPKPIKRWHLELVENEFHNLLSQSVQRCAETYGYIGDGVWGRYEWVSEGKHDGVDQGYFDLNPSYELLNMDDLQTLSEHDKKSLDREVQKLTHRRIQDRKHLKQVAKIYNEELSRATKAGKRPRMTREVMAQMGTREGTARLWIKNARDEKLIPSRNSKQISTPSKVRKAVPDNKTTPTKKTGSTNVKKS